MEVVDHFVYSCLVDGVTLPLKKTPSLDYNLPYCWRHSLTHLFNHKSNTLYDGSGIFIQAQYCAREASMSMLMEFSRSFVLMKAS